MNDKTVRYRIASFAVFSTLIASFGAPARAGQPSALPERDALVIAEALHLWQSAGERCWSGWTRIAMPIIYVKADHEYAIGFPMELKDATALGRDPVLGRAVQVRPRTQSPTSAASFDVEGIHAVVIGTPESLQWTPTHWVIKAVHEMFHVLEGHRGSASKTADLEIGPKNDAASWQLTFPFPYEDLNVMRLVHLRGYLLYVACTSTEVGDVRYAAGTALEAARVLQATLTEKTGDDRAYRYAKFQELSEGIAYYTEYRMAELAADEAYKPLGAFRSLPGVIPYDEYWADYKNQLFMVKHAGRAVRNRLMFYHLGLGTGLVLDRLLPDWKDRFFAPTMWLDDLLAEAVGSQTLRETLKAGDTAPMFNLHTLDEVRFSQETLYGSVVLMDFWQTWCPPCVAGLPYLNGLQKRFGDQGLRIIGVVERLDASGEADLRRFVREHKMSFPNLLDSTGGLARDYGIRGYPHLFLVDRAGTVRLADRGVIAEGKGALEAQIETLLAEPKP